MELKGNLIILTFDRYEDKMELSDALNGSKYKSVLDIIANNIFRPNRKHGYSNQELEKLREIPEVSDAIDILETMFYTILSEKNVDLNE